MGAVPLTIGREPSSNVPVHSEEVSRSHAYILRTPQGFLLVDSSLHGTYVNGERVQAQRILADGDLVQIGAESFRFDLRSADAPSDSGPMPGGAPETSQYARAVPLGAGATGKLRLALALAERDSWKSRVRTWVKRYGPSEVAGIGMALGVSWLVQQSTGNVIAAAYGASIGEALEFCLVFSGHQRPEVVLSAMWKAHCRISPMQRQSTRSIHLCGNKRGVRAGEAWMSESLIPDPPIPCTARAYIDRCIAARWPPACAL